MDPTSAPWLSPRERTLVLTNVEREDAASERNLWAALRNPRLLAIALVALRERRRTLWHSALVAPNDKRDGLFQSGDRLCHPLCLTIAGAAAMVLWGRSSDRRREQIWHIAIALLVAALGLGLASIARAPLPTVIALTIAIVGSMAYFGPFFSLPSSFLSGPAMAGGISNADQHLHRIGRICGADIDRSDQTGDWKLCGRDACTKRRTSGRDRDHSFGRPGYHRPRDSNRMKICSITFHRTGA